MTYPWLCKAETDNTSVHVCNHTIKASLAGSQLAWKCAFGCQTREVGWPGPNCGLSPLDQQLERGPLETSRSYHQNHQSTHLLTFRCSKACRSHGVAASELPPSRAKVAVPLPLADFPCKLAPTRDLPYTAAASTTILYRVLLALLHASNVHTHSRPRRQVICMPREGYNA